MFVEKCCVFAIGKTLVLKINILLKAFFIYFYSKINVLVKYLLRHVFLTSANMLKKRVRLRRNVKFKTLHNVGPMVQGSPDKGLPFLHKFLKWKQLVLWKNKHDRNIWGFVQLVNASLKPYIPIWRLIAAFIISNLFFQICDVSFISCFAF